MGQSSRRPYYMHSIAAEALSRAMYGERRLDYCSFMHDSLKGEVNLNGINFPYIYPQRVNRPGHMYERARRTIARSRKWKSLRRLHVYRPIPHTEGDQT